MKRDDIIKLGVNEELAATLENSFLEELKGYIPKSRFDEVNKERKRLETELNQRDEQLLALKNSTGDIDELKKQIEKLQAENQEKDARHNEEVRQLKIDAAVEAALINAGSKNKIAVKALLKDLDNAEFDENGLIKGLTEQIEALKESDEYLFEIKDSKKKLRGVAPAETGNDDIDKGVDTSKMTYSQLAAYMAEHPDIKI